MKHKWIKDELGDYKCSKCGHIVCDEEDVYDGFKYCPECGDKKKRGEVNGVCVQIPE